MAVTGQFGKVITGSGSVASAISGIASNYITLRLNRIYDAFVNKETFEGREVTAAVAIELLNKMLAMTSKGGKSQDEVNVTLRAVRKANRTRTLNEIDTDLVEKGSMGDYANKVRVIEEMLLDPTLNPDDIDDLKEELTDATDDLLENAQNEFSNGGKIVINGKTIDFASGANEEAFLKLYDDAIERTPDASQKINKARVRAQASILVAKGNAAWLSKTRNTDAEKNAGYTEQLKFLREAYDLLSKSEFGLLEDANQILGSIRSVEGNQETARENMAIKGAGTRVTQGYDNIFGDLDTVNKELKSNPAIAALMGDYTFAQLLMGDQNFALTILDRFTATNGDTVLRDDGTRITLNIDNLSKMMVDARTAAKGLANWAKNNPFVSESDKATIAKWDAFGAALGKAAPILTVEDRYDDAVDDLSRAMDEAGADIGARAKALRAFSGALRAIGGLAGVPKDVRAALTAEATFYETGQRPADTSTLYGDYSGNLSGQNGLSGIYNMENILGGLISPNANGDPLSIFQAVTRIYQEEAAWTAGEGTVITDIDGNDVGSVGPQDTAAWEKGQGVILKTLGTITIGNTTISTLVDQNLQRIRLVSPGGQTDPDNLNNFTVGWVARVKDKNGNWNYIVTQKDGSGERLLKGDAALAFVNQYLKRGNWTTLQQNIGGNIVISLDTTGVEALEGADEAGKVSNTGLVDGSLWTLLSTPESNYGWATEYANLVTESIKKAILAKQLFVRDGKVFLRQASGVDLDITGRLSADMVTSITTIFPTVDTTPGEGAANTSGGGEEGNVPPKPVGKDRWKDTQWAGQEGSTVISKTASGKDLTLDEAFSSGTGYMWDTAPKPTGRGGGALPMGVGAVSPAEKAKLDAAMAKYDRTKMQGIKGAGMKNVVSGGISKAQIADEGGYGMLRTFMRNMPTGTGKGNGAQSATGLKARGVGGYRPIARRQF